MAAPVRTESIACLGGLLLLAACGAPAPSAENIAAPASSAAAPPAASIPGPAPNFAADEAELISLEKRYAQALIERDRDFLMRFYAPDWRGGNYLGFWTKATMLKAVLEARYTVKSMELRNLKVRVLGDIAVVQGLDEEVTTIDGKDTSGRWTFTDIFARRDGRWVAIASHTSELKPNAPPQ
jgi:hypothetical protein